MPVSCTDGAPLVPVPAAACHLPSAAPPPFPLPLWSLQGTSGHFLTRQRSVRRPMDPAALRPWTNRSKQWRRACGRVVEQHFASTGRSIPRGRDAHAAQALAARKALAGIACQSDTAARLATQQGQSRRLSPWPAVRGQGSAVALQEKRGPPEKPQTFITRAPSPG